MNYESFHHWHISWYIPDCHKAATKIGEWMKPTQSWSLLEPRVFSSDWMSNRRSQSFPLSNLDSSWGNQNDLVNWYHYEFLNRIGCKSFVGSMPLLNHPRGSFWWRFCFQSINFPWLGSYQASQIPYDQIIWQQRLQHHRWNTENTGNLKL